MTGAAVFLPHRKGDKMENKIKAIVTAVAGWFMSMLGVLAVPVLILIGCNAIDYATGLLAAKYRQQALDSYKGFRGIAKKVCMWLLVAVGAVIDWLLKYASDTVGISLPFTFFVACVVAIWLICNELLSIMENIADIGVPLPSFLTRIAKYVKKQAESKIDEIDLDETDEAEGGDDDESE